MDDLERAFRDALRRADTVEVPVRPIDPAEFSGRSRRWGAWPRTLAAAAVVMFVVGVSIAVWVSAGRGIPAVPVTTGEPAPPTTAVAAATVVVDAYSGRENPTIELDGSLADTLYATLADYQAAGDMGVEASSLPGLGFRGFVVTPADRDRPTLRVLPGSVWVGPDGEAGVLRDPTTFFFDTITSALTPELRELVASGSVQLRVRNAGKMPMTDLKVELPSHQVITAESLGTGEDTGYQFVGQTYSYARVFAKVNGEDRKLLPADYVGETPLAPGRYTYQLRVRGGQLELELTHDADGERPEQPDAPDGGPSDGPPGDAASWVLVHPDQVGPDSTEITIGVTRLDCNDGVTGEVLEPVVEYTESELVIRALVAPIDTDLPRTCQGNDQVAVVVKLTEPIGHRNLVDAGGSVRQVRWTP